MQNELGYSYKRGASRSFLSKNPKLVYMQAVFAARMLSWINNSKVIINVDESSYTKSTKIDYSWLPRGKSYPIINTHWKASLNWIFAITTQGQWIALLNNNTIKSNEFWRFLFILKKFMEECTDISINDVIITLDNAPIHCSIKTKAWAAKLRFSLEWLPPYTPNFASVETVFGMTKTMIARKKNTKCLDFSRSTGANWLKDSLFILTDIKVKSLWTDFINEAKLSIFTALDQAKKHDILKRTNDKQEEEKI